MSHKQQGFVLRRFLPQQQKLSILDQTYGKIQVMPTQRMREVRIWPGMLIAYHLEVKQSSLYTVSTTELLFAGEFSSFPHISWFHQLLEWCYYTCPLEQPQPMVFDILYAATLALTMHDYFGDQLVAVQLLLELALCHEFGYYAPPTLKVAMQHAVTTARIFVDFSSARTIESLAKIVEIAREIPVGCASLWVRSCVQQHPQFRHFKTYTVTDYEKIKD